MKLGRKHRERQLLLDMTPLIDIVFQLLIFFLMSAQMVNLSRADISLPEERGEQKPAEQAGLIINIDKDGKIIVSDRDVSLDELDSLVREAIRQSPERSAALVKLMIRADRNADAAKLNAVIERLHQQGVGAARVATSPPR